jgi:hypothetical protein
LKEIDNKNNMQLGKKVVAKREEARYRELHELRLKTMKCKIDTTIPASLSYRGSNSKKFQLLEEKCTEIERENRILFEKMLRIKDKTPPILRPSMKKSLNLPYRRQRLQEIEHANSQLLKRLKEKESCYRLELFNSQRRETEKILSTISEFPILNSEKKRASLNISKHKTVKLKPISENLVYRQGKIMNGQSYLIETYKKEDEYKIIAFNLATNDNAILFLSSDQVNEICGETAEYKTLVKHLYLSDSGLSFQPPRSLSSLN